MNRDIDRVIASIRRGFPALVCERPRAADPAVADRGLWILRHPDLPGEVQLESSTGLFPFLVESAGSPARDTVHTLEEAVALVMTRLRLAAVRH